jgi:hypothetical protein
MQERTQKHDDFGTFLWSMQKAMKEQKGNDTSMRIMYTLSRHEQAKVIQVMTQVKSSWNDFTDGLKWLQEAGLIKMDDDDEGGTLRLTDDGRHWAQTMVEADEGDEL